MSEKSLKEQIVEELKDEGMNIAEDALADSVKLAFKILPKIALHTKNKVDDMFIPVLGLVEKQALSLVDKLDGEDDPER